MIDSTKQKETLRQEALRHMARMDVREEQDLSAVSEAFFKTVTVKETDIVAAYWPKGREFDPHDILDQLAQKNIKCALPVVRADERVLGFALWKEGDAMYESRFGIAEPVQNYDTQWVEPDILIVPLLAFDRRGYRLGYGGGYYDATLRHLRHVKAIKAVGVGYAQQACLFPLPNEDHDEKLDYVITPQGFHDFTEDS